MSKSPLFWKFVVIFLVLGAAVAFGFPPQKRINLGLDLRGGTHILMQVQTGAALKYQLDLTQNWIGNGLQEKNLTYDSILPTGEATLEVRGTDPSPGRPAWLRRWAGSHRRSGSFPSDRCRSSSASGRAGTSARLRSAPASECARRRAGRGPD